MLQLQGQGILLCDTITRIDLHKIFFVDSRQQVHLEPFWWLETFNCWCNHSKETFFARTPPNYSRWYHFEAAIICYWFFVLATIAVHMAIESVESVVSATAKKNVMFEDAPWPVILSNRAVSHILNGMSFSLTADSVSQSGGWSRINKNK